MATLKNVEAEQEKYAGLFSWLRDLDLSALNFRTRKEPSAGSPENEDTAEDDFLQSIQDPDGRIEPHFGPETDEPAVTEELKFDLMSSIANIWHQETVDPVALARVENFKFEKLDHDYAGAMALFDDEDNVIYFGVDPADHSHSVASPAGISPRIALEQVYVALTDDLMRNQGIDDVQGTHLDKALLCLAAEKHGLKINDVPVLSDEVKAEAQKLWNEAFPPEEVAPAPEAEPEVIRLLPLLDPPAQRVRKKPAPQLVNNDVIYLSHIPFEEEPSAGNTPLLPYMGGPSPSQEGASEQRLAKLKEKTLDVLAGTSAEETVSPETFLHFVDGLKAGEFSDKQGILDESLIRAAFDRKVGDGSTEGEVLMQAAIAQGVVYKTTKEAPALRMMVNPHVDAAVHREKKATTLYDTPSNALVPEFTTTASGKFVRVPETAVAVPEEEDSLRSTRRDTEMHMQPA